ncbi:MAG: HlyD family secretion protein [Gemmatimonadetes bacterium]|nr:HlyD family secretion protein [Gemmatimonadota bacterium]
MADETKGPGGPPAGGPSGEPPTGSPGAPPAGSKPAGGGARNGRRSGLLAAAALILIALIAGGYWYLKVRGVVSTDDAYIDGDRATVTTKALGRITSLGADEGDTVQAGRILVQLDTADLQAHLAQAAAQLELARTSVQLAVVSEKRAKDDAERAAVQIKGNAITREQYDHAQTTLESAAAEHQVALAKVQAARASVGVIEQQIADTRVTAPFRGVIAKRWLLPGDVVQPGQPIFTVYDLDNVWVTAVFEETKLRYLPIGTVVDLSVDAYPDRTFSGRVILIGAAAASQFSLIPPANASGNFTKVTQRIPVRIAIDKASDTDEPPHLLPGMSVVVTVHDAQQ